MPGGNYRKTQRLNELIGSNLRRIRERQGIPQEILAKHIRMSRPAIVNMEQGRQNFYAHVLYDLSFLLGCRMSEFFRKSGGARER